MNTASGMTDAALIEKCRANPRDEAALKDVITRYWKFVVSHASHLLPNKRVEDEQAIANKVFTRLWKMFLRNKVKSSESLQPLLRKITSGKVADHVKKETAVKRNRGRTRGGSALAEGGGSGSQTTKPGVPRPRNPRQQPKDYAGRQRSSPASAAIRNLTRLELRERLASERDRRIFDLLLEKYSTSATEQQLRKEKFKKVSKRTIERTRQTIRKLFKDEQEKD